MFPLPHCEAWVRSGSLFYGIQGYSQPGEEGEGEAGDKSGGRGKTTTSGFNRVSWVQPSVDRHRHEGGHLHRHLGDSVQDTYSKCSINAHPQDGLTICHER